MTDPRDRPEGANREESSGPASRGSVFAKWAERAVWVFVMVLVLRQFGPQVGAAVGLGRSLGTVPDFQVTTLDGDLIASSDLRGKVVLVNFWATWCGPCRVEMPGFQRVYDDYKDRGFVILGLSTDRGDRTVVTEFLEARSVNYPVAISTPELEEAFAGIRGLPMSFLIDREGVIQNRVYGFFAPPALRLAVRSLIQEEGDDISRDVSLAPALGGAR